MNRKQVNDFVGDMYPSLEKELKEVESHMTGFYEIRTGVLDYVLLSLVGRFRENKKRLSVMLFAAAFAAWRAEKGLENID